MPVVEHEKLPSGILERNHPPAWKHQALAAAGAVKIGVTELDYEQRAAAEARFVIPRNLPS